MTIPDASKRTVIVPVEWIDGKWQLYGGGELPMMKDGASADLVLPAVYLSDPDDFARLTQEITVPFLPKLTELLVRVTSDRVPRHLLDKTVERADRVGATQRFVIAKLKADLSISFVSGKKGKLNDCKCLIPALGQTADSVNEAYRKIAIAFEPSRRSDSGSVFRLAFIETGARLVRLDEIRDKLTLSSLELSELMANEQASMASERCKLGRLVVWFILGGFPRILCAEI